MEKNKMLIDATHPEETRVVVLRGGRVEEFDYESASRKPLRGNIYLAKVTPSAATCRWCPTWCSAA
jgi:ribonuclease E